jgi:hypothetical protein
MPARVAIRPLTTIPYLFPKVHICSQLTVYDASSTTCSARAQEAQDKMRKARFKASSHKLHPFALFHIHTYFLTMRDFEQFRKAFCIIGTENFCRPCQGLGTYPS